LVDHERKERGKENLLPKKKRVNPAYPFGFEIYTVGTRVDAGGEIGDDL